MTHLLVPEGKMISKCQVPFGSRLHLFDFCISATGLDVLLYIFPQMWSCGNMQQQTWEVSPLPGAAAPLLGSPISISQQEGFEGSLISLALPRPQSYLHCVSSSLPGSSRYTYLGVEDLGLSEEMPEGSLPWV